MIVTNVVGSGWIDVDEVNSHSRPDRLKFPLPIPPSPTSKAKLDNNKLYTIKKTTNGSSEVLWQMIVSNVVGAIKWILFLDRIGPKPPTLLKLN